MPKDLNSKQAGFLKEKGVADPSVRVYKGKNLFPQSFQHPSSCQYGFVDPVAFAKCEAGDIYPYKFVSDLNTHTLASPLKSKVTMYTSAFKVPMQAIYPRNWDIMFPHPNKGEDVPDDCRAILDIKELVKRINDSFEIAYNNDLFDVWVRLHFISESIFSDGGIFAKFNIHYCHSRFSLQNASNPLCFDDYFDDVFCRGLKAYFQNMDSSGPSSRHLSHYSGDSSYNFYCVTDDTNLYGTESYVDTFYISFDRAIELLRSGDYVLATDGNVSTSDYWSDFPVLPNSFMTDINIEPIIAYQLACSHFFNNPKIDFIYSAQLYRDNMESLFYSVSDPFFFTWNGINKLYDVFSSSVMNSMVDFNRLGVLSSTSDVLSFLGFWQNLFNYHNSLRAGDYFVSAHPEPIAPGDINAPVVDGSVNALDMTKKLQIARYLNKVNITGPRMADYLKNIFGVNLPEAPKDSPVRLSKESFEVGGFEVNNTGNEQLSSDSPNITTTNLRLDDSRFMFEASIDEPCYIIVVQYFDAHRIYSRTIDRFAFHYDRYDDFIPDLQFIGDQDVKRNELSALSDPTTVFAYNLRYMEYKQRYSYASGAFIRRLKSWAFVTDNKDGNMPTNHITPEYIRSSPSEFDRFYKSLSGYSLGTRYHFITYNTNVAAPYRPMVYAPEILA